MVRMTVVAVMWFVASACGAPQRQEMYEKGAYRPVRAPAFTPTEDAPHAFSPDKPPRVEPGPRPGRVLPETPETRREPGLWSWDPPKASEVDRVGPVTLLQTVLPLPLIDSTHVAAGPAKACVGTFHLLFLAQNFTPILKPITSEPERACFVAKLYDLCARTTSAAFPRDDAEFPKTIPRESIRLTRRHTGMTKDVADAFKKEKCHDASETEVVKRAFDDVRAAWLKQFPNGAIDL